MTRRKNDSSPVERPGSSDWISVDFDVFAALLTSRRPLERVSLATLGQVGVRDQADDRVYIMSETEFRQGVARVHE
jgi:hypothetical protein